MSLRSGFDGGDPGGPEPVGRLGGFHEERRATRSTLLAVGTLACPECDAPVVVAGRPLGPAAPLGCGFCGYAGALREFLSLAEPSRPARVAVRVVSRGRVVVAPR